MKLYAIRNQEISTKFSFATESKLHVFMKVFAMYVVQNRNVKNVRYKILGPTSAFFHGHDTHYVVNDRFNFVAQLHRVWH